MKLLVFLRAILAGGAFVIGGLVGTPVAVAALSVDTSPGNGAPPATLGGYTMVPSPQDTRTNNMIVSDAPTTPTSNFAFSPSTTLLAIGQNWCATSWAGGSYSGRIYDTPDNTVTITLPAPMSAVDFYAQPDQYGALNLTATAQDGTSVSSGPTPSQAYSCRQATPASGQFFGFYGTNGDKIQSITISLDDPNAVVPDFAVGDFAVPVEQYVADLASAVQGVGPGSSLASKVNAVQSALSSLDTSTACSILAAFVSQVNAQTGKSIDPATASQLITDFVKPIQSALGCA